MPMLFPLLSSQYPQVKKNVTWALYRIHSRSNTRVVDELKKLVKSDTEFLSVRINAVRALGAIGLDSSRLKVWETLLDVIKLRGDKFLALRTFAVESLGDLRESNPSIINTLAKIAEREKNLELKKEAVLSLRKIASENTEVENSLERVFRTNKDLELRIRVIETLGDMYSPKTAELTADILNDNLSDSQKKRIIYASLVSVFGALVMSSFTQSTHSTGNTACEIYGKVKIVDYGEDYKVKIVDYGEDLKVKWVDYGEDSKGKWKKVDYGEKFKIKWVDYGEDFKIKEVTYGEGC